MEVRSIKSSNNFIKINKSIPDSQSTFRKQVARKLLIAANGIFSSASLEYFSRQQSCDALRDLVPFVQFKKCEKNPWRSVRLVKLQAKGLQLY